MNTSTTFSTLRILLLAMCIAVASGCGKKDDGAKSEAKDKDKGASQVAAKVNAEEITVHQINSVLSRNQNIPPEAAAKAKFEILDKLIDQQIAKQQAVEQKLDRKPAVMQAIEAARNEILARAYLEQITAAQARPTAEEIKTYYNEHPELFADRRIFDLEEVVVAPQPDLAAKLREQVTKVRSMPELATWLKSQNIQFAPNRGVRPAEALPLDLLPKLHSMKDGEIRVIENNERLYVFRVVGSKKAPVTETQATPRIQLFLTNQRSRDVVVAEITRLKKAANIEYVGEFSGGAESAAAKAKADAESKAKAAEKTKADADQQAQAKAQAKAKEQAEADARADALSKARREAEEKAKAEPSKSAPGKPALVPQDTIDKGVRGIK